VTRVVVTSPADADTASIVTYLGTKAGYNIAARYIASFENLYNRLADHPDSGAPRPALGLYVRISIISPYIVIYDHDEAADTVTILRIVHGRRKITGNLLLTGIGSL
jgi:toxin ParE1/3/4